MSDDENPMPQPFGYVTFDDAGSLTGSYFQVLHPAHSANHIPVGEEVRAEWVHYRANAARDDIELAPPVEPPPSVVPSSVTRRQARQALLLEGLLDDVQPAIDSIPDATERRLAQIEWEDSLEFVRSRPLVIQIGAALGLDEAALDALFIHAATL